MRKKLFIFWGLAWAAQTAFVQAGTSVSVADAPHGVFTLSAPQGMTTYLSLPLESETIFAGTVSSVQSNVIQVSAPANPFTGTLTTASAPSFVKFLSGAEKGRTLLITANTSSSLTLGVTDNGSASISLLTTNFAVSPGDLFEIFAGDTLGSIFGTNTARNPLAVTGAASPAAADWVNLPNPVSGSWQVYFFNTALGYWVLEGSTANANNTLLYPNTALAITRRNGSGPAGSILLTGRVPSVSQLIKMTGSSSVTYAAIGCPVSTTLSKLSLGPNWVKGSTPAAANQLGIWSSSTRTFISYYQLADSTWRQVGNPTLDQSSLIVPAGSCVALQLHSSTAGASSFLSPALPYTLSN